MKTRETIGKILCSLVVIGAIVTLGLYHYRIGSGSGKVASTPSRTSLYQDSKPGRPDGPTTKEVTVGGLKLTIKNEFVERSFFNVKNSILNRALKKGWEIVDLGPGFKLNPVVRYRNLDKLTFLTPDNKIAVYILTTNVKNGTHISSTLFDVNHLLNQPVVSNSNHLQTVNVPSVYKNIIVGKPTINIGKNLERGSSLLVCISDTEVDQNEKTLVSRLKRDGWQIQKWPDKLAKKDLIGRQKLVIASKDSYLCHVMLGRFDNRTFATYRLSKDFSLQKY